MKRFKIIGAVACMFFMVFACTEDTLDAELDEYCECVKTSDTHESRNKCHELMQEISDKYAFDPEASERINERVKDCIK